LKKKLYWPIFALILFWFSYFNIPFLKNYLLAGFDGPTNITLGNQLQSINWIYQDAKGEKFNVDIYVPPVIPYSYAYLIQWQGERVYHQQPELEEAPFLYTLYEVDYDHILSLDTWLAERDKIAETIKVQKFGGITVERRLRINP